MSMIWLVGAQDEWMEEFADVVNGFYAVKRIASVKNFTRLIKMQTKASLEGVFFVLRVMPFDELMSMHSAVSVVESNSILGRICFVGEVSESLKQILSSKKITFIEQPADLVETCKEIRRVFASVRPSLGAQSTPDILKIGDIEIDRLTSTMKITNTHITEPLTPKEIRILQVLSASADQVISREELVSRVWTGTHVSASTVDSHMSRLRKKIEQSFECSIETQYGSGWTLLMRGDLR